MSKAEPLRRTGNRVAAFWLGLTLLAVTLGPRIRLSEAAGQAVDIRIQDLLLIPILVYLLHNRVRPYALSRLWSWLLPAFLWGSLFVTVASLFADATIPLIRRVAFYGRGLELFIIAVVIAGLYIRAGDRGMRVVVRAFLFAAFVNSAWVLYQIATGNKGTVLGDRDLSEAVVAYGPQLFGEPSAFGTGQFFAFSAALGVAALRTKTISRVAAVLLIAMGVAGAFLAESRASLISVSIAVVIMFLFAGRARRVNPIGLIFVSIAGVIGFVLLYPQLEGRLSADGIMRSLTYRHDAIWEPLLSRIFANPLVGIGPGALVRPGPVEGHNVILRAWLDYGLLVGSLFILLFVVVLVRSYRVSHERDAPDDVRLFSNLAFVFITNIFIAGIFQDSLTAVTSSHLAMVTVGLFAAVLLRAPDAHPSSIEKFRIERIRT